MRAPVAYWEPTLEPGKDLSLPTCKSNCTCPHRACTQEELRAKYDSELKWFEKRVKHLEGELEISRAKWVPSTL